MFVFIQIFVYLFCIYPNIYFLPSCQYCIEKKLITLDLKTF